MAKRYAGTFGAMADAFGFAEKESYNMASALTGLAGDVASFYNITQDEAYTKLKSVFTGETETLKDLGVVMTQNALDLRLSQTNMLATKRVNSQHSTPVLSISRKVNTRQQQSISANLMQMTSLSSQQQANCSVMRMWNWKIMPKQPRHTKLLQRLRTN
jgi:hypothetical protein